MPTDNSSPAKDLIDYLGRRLPRLRPWRDAIRRARTQGDVDGAISATMEFAFELFADAANTGVPVRKGAKRGGRKLGSNDVRDTTMVREFLKLVFSKEGQEIVHGLGRSQAIAAINRGLKKPSG